MSDSVRPHRRQPTRLPCPWDSPGKNTGVGCHFLLQCVKVKALSRVRLCDPMDCSPPGSSAHGILQARVLEWGAIAFSDKEALLNVYFFKVLILGVCCCCYKIVYLEGKKKMETWRSIREKLISMRIL